MNLRARFLTVLMTGCAACAFVGAAAAADEAGITVTGTGEALARPDRVEIDLTVAGTAELTGDAIVKYNDMLRRTTDAFAALKLDDLTIEQRSLEFTSGGGGNAAQQAALLGVADPNASLKPEVGISRSLRVVLADVGKLPEDELMETIGKLLDTAQDAGAAVAGGGNEDALVARMMGVQASSSAVATFVVENPEESRERAYQRAFDAAKARAERLAALSGGRLGVVLSIEETQDLGGEDEEEGMQEKMIKAVYGIGGGSEADGRLTSKKLGDIPVRVSLRVRFSLDDSGQAPSGRTP